MATSISQINLGKMAIILQGKSVKGVSLNGKAVKQIEKDGEIVWSALPAGPDYFWIENCDSVSGSISFENMYGLTDLEYSTDLVNWVSVTFSSASYTIADVQPNTRVYLRGENLSPKTYIFPHDHIKMDVNHNIGGNICTLLSKENYDSVTDISNSRLYSLFRNDVKLMSAMINWGSVMSISGTLYSMFEDCTNLQTITAPNVSTWDTSKFSSWVAGAGTSAANPQMLFDTQELLDACPSGASGYGAYTKVLAS